MEWEKSHTWMAFCFGMSIFVYFSIIVLICGCGLFLLGGSIPDILVALGVALMPVVGVSGIAMWGKYHYLCRL